MELCLFPLSLSLSAEANLSRAVLLSPASHLHVSLLFSRRFTISAAFFFLLCLYPIASVYIFAARKNNGPPRARVSVGGYLCIALLSVSERSKQFADPLTSLSEGYQSKAWCVSH